MGDMADFILEQMDWEAQDEDQQHSPYSYLYLTNEELVKQTSFVRSERSKGIRNWYLKYKTLSDKQRWVLANDLFDKDYR